MLSAGQPDVVLLVLDTLRADRLSCYGYHRLTSPHIDRFAESAALYEQAVSPAQWTIPAHASIFTGEYPTTHMTTQIYDRHRKDQLTLAELLTRAGYQTAGFCNNPLLGVVDNDLDRGFEEMYNYGGAVPVRPSINESGPRWMSRLSQRVGRFLNHLTTPIQDVFARNETLLRIALHPRIVPLWQGQVNFKGNTRQSLRDIVGYLQSRRARGRERPLFTFINLMETHLPYAMPQRFIRRFAPYLQDDREARDFIKGYNLEHYRWMVPLIEPLTDLQDRVINDLYDAEVAYEDHLLRHLFDYLDEPDVRDNTLVIITSDHGEGLNHHDFVGHSLVAYNDLVHVPLIVRYPEGRGANEHVRKVVSSRRIFHTVLDQTGVGGAIDPDLWPEARTDDVRRLNLANAFVDPALEPRHVFSEAYVPDTLIRLMSNIDQDVEDRFRWRESRRAVYEDGFKLITVGDEPDELFDVRSDPGELVNLLAQYPEMVLELNGALAEFLSAAESRRSGDWTTARVDLDEDEELVERLRGLGYL
ncbi:MAG: sulfatase-like hydrolase/transferase [Chloroflexi bacterium]|nr:sulfatase-like hydrolase/transferase [Chloroflexota bacterium]